MAEMCSSYPKILIYNHAAMGSELFDGPVVIQEKYDGSQFSFWLDDSGKLRARSKRVELDINESTGLFALALGTVRRLAKLKMLREGFVYRAEAFAGPRHNSIKYGRVPTGGMVLYDIEVADGTQKYMTCDDVKTVAECFGVEPCRTYIYGEASPCELPCLLKHESTLGGSLIEGVVIKNYAKYGRDGKVLMGKLVRAEFKEQNRVTHAKAGAVETLIERFRCDARWRKAVEHLRDDGALTGEARDIPALLKEVQRDLVDEEGDEIKEALWSHYKREILRGVTKGLPEWYKSTLAGQE